MNFSDNYTDLVKDYYFDFDDNYDYEMLNKLNTEIGDLSDNASPKQFKEKMDQIREEYFCSARRFLIEYVKDLSTVAEDGSFDFEYNGKKYHFTGCGIDAARSLSKEERDQYISLFTDIAIDNNEEERTKDNHAEWRKLFRIAMLWNKNPKLLTKEEGLKICHGLNFTFKQAGDFMVRVLENDGFNFASSNDLIELFCFMHIGANNWHVAEALKKEYEEKTAGIAKISAEEKEDQGTRMILDNLPSSIKKWEQIVTDQTVEEKFMQWLVDKAPTLDRVSKTSYEIYRKLCCMAYKMCVNLQENENYIFEGDAEITDQIYDFLEDYADEIEEIAANVSYYDLQKKLVTYVINEFDNRRILNQEEYWKAWRYITIGSDGGLTTQGIGDRMLSLLEGNEFVQKADMLILIWVICHMHWVNNNSSDDDYIFNTRVQDFLNFAEDILDEAMLPAFYAPHLLEQSMLMSICYICDEELENDMEPLEIYEEICECFAPRRVREKADKKQNQESQDGDNGTESSGKKEKLNDIRLVWENEIKESYINGQITFDGIEKVIAVHLQENAMVKKDYVFQPEGISYAPNPEIIIQSNPFIQERFNKNNADYKALDANEERFKYLYAIYLYLQEEAQKQGHKLTCGVYYKANCKISITKWK